MKTHCLNISYIYYISISIIKKLITSEGKKDISQERRT